MALATTLFALSLASAPAPALTEPTLAGEPAHELAPKPKIAEDGRGSLATGGVLLGAGAALLGGSLAGAGSGAPADLWVPFAVSSALPLTLGGLLIGVGHKRLRRYRAWERSLGYELPPQGNGLRSPGIVLTALGSGAVVMGGILTLGTRASIGFQVEEPDEPPPPVYPLAILGVGAAALGTGITLMLIGERRRKAFEAWESGPEIVPTLAPLPGGAQLGLAGAF